MSDKVEFLSELLSRPWLPGGKSGVQPVGLFIGQEINALEVAVAQASQSPTRSAQVEIWKARKGRRAAPLLLVVLHPGGATLTGATGEVPPVYEDMDVGQVERLGRNPRPRHPADRGKDQSNAAIYARMVQGRESRCEVSLVPIGYEEKAASRCSRLADQRTEARAISEYCDVEISMGGDRQ